MLDIIKEGMLAIQVCTDEKKKEDIERLANEKLLCGTTGGWKLDEKESKRLGQAKVKCSENNNKTHYILYA